MPEIHCEYKLNVRCTVHHWFYIIWYALYLLLCTCQWTISHCVQYFHRNDFCHTIILLNIISIVCLHIIYDNCIILCVIKVWVNIFYIDEILLCVGIYNVCCMLFTINIDEARISLPTESKFHQVEGHIAELANNNLNVIFCPMDICIRPMNICIRL